MSYPSLRTVKGLLALSLLFASMQVFAATHPTLFSISSGNAEVLAQGAQKSWPIKLSEDNALDAVFQGGMWLPNPSGGRIYAKYLRHIVHPNGTWSWIGTVSTVRGDQSVVLTFGKDGAFGLIPQASGYPLRIVTAAGQTRVVETSAEGMARSTQALRLHSEPDFVIPPRAKSVGDHDTVSRMTAAEMAARASSSGPATIDVMVAFTSGFVSELGSQNLALTRIQNLVDISNTAYFDSGVNQRIRLVHAVQVNYPDDTSNSNALDDVTGLDVNGDPVPIPASLQGIAALRTQYGADLVSLIRSYDYATQGGCGIGWLIGGDQEPIVPAKDNVYGYNVVSDGSNGGYYCLDTTFVHELGHNMGDAHDRANAAHAGAYSYSYGYLGNGTDGFSTIMAYGPDTDTPLAMFSNPNISTCQNTPCGVPDNSSDSADNVHSMNNTAALIAQFEPTVVGIPLAYPSDYVRNDVNGDGKSDLLWMNAGKNSFGYWLMNGANVTALWSTSVASGYRVVATGDFNGDGMTDLIWTSSKNDLYLWTSNGTSFTSYPIGTYPAGTQVIAAADVDGDGDSDLLFMDTKASTFSYWLMNGATVTGKWSTQVASGYSIAAIGDFNGDGRADLVWTSGARDLYLWTSNGSNFSSHYIGTYPAGWQLVGAGDVDGDGLSDLLWRNQGAGLFGWWIMHGATQVSATSIAASSAYQIAATGDFNGDGKVDVIWTSSKRDLYLWTSNGSGFNAQYIGTYPAGWSVIPSQLMAAGQP